MNKIIRIYLISLFIDIISLNKFSAFKTEKKY